MLRNVFLKTLRDQRRALLLWGIGLLAIALFTGLLYPSIRQMAPEYDKLLKTMPEALIKPFVGEFSDFASPEGYLNSSLFFLMLPLLFLVFAIGFGSNAIAGEEERGTMDLLLSNPLPRWRVVVEKFAALVVSTILLAFAFWLGLAICALAVELGVSLGRMAEATMSGALLGFAFGALALAVGCACGDRGLSLGVASAVAVAAYFLNSLAPVVKVLERYRRLSPFYYYIGADPLKNGLNLGHAAVLIGLTGLLLVVALLAFERRDLAV
jgi:ABC-2 type transport system permease protein